MLITYAIPKDFTFGINCNQKTLYFCIILYSIILLVKMQTYIQNICSRYGPMGNSSDRFLHPAAKTVRT